uniref:Uncharacterized protein n=1 Tax=virus sp. ctqq75 TaxID=2827999 RepID=A0A8S5REV0_9VIRU|nr:MAG TPA: hypothetical protein [virus sp. ctqq75]
MSMLSHSGTSRTTQRPSTSFATPLEPLLIPRRLL